MNQNILKHCEPVEILFSEMTIKGETHEEVDGQLSSEDEIWRLISHFYSTVHVNLTKMIAATTAKALVKSSKLVIKFMKAILAKAQSYEARWQIAPDYDLSNETKIHSLGWYALLIRQTMRHQTLLGNAMDKQLDDGSGEIASQMIIGEDLLDSLRTHSCGRYPEYENYRIV